VQQVQIMSLGDMTEAISINKVHNLKSVVR